MTVWTPLGNVQEWSLTPKPTTIDHKNTQGPLKVVDLTALTLFAMDFSITADEWTPDNMEMALAGTSIDTTAGRIINIGVAAVRRQMKFTGANEFGPNWEVILPNVFIASTEKLSLISSSDEFAPINLSGKILYAAAIQSFGTAQKIAGGAVTGLSPDLLNYYLGTGSVYTAPLA